MVTGMNHITLAVDPDRHKLEIHVGNPYNRIFAKKADPSPGENGE